MPAKEVIYINLFGKAFSELSLLGLGPLGAVLGTGLHTAGNALRIQSTADNVVPNAGEILHAAAADHDDGVLLQGVTHAGDISGDLVAVGQTNTGDLTQSGVRLLGGSRSHSGANASLLRGGQIGAPVLQGVQAELQRRGRGLVAGLLPSFTDQLVKSRHTVLLSCQIS